MRTDLNDLGTLGGPRRRRGGPSRRGLVLLLLLCVAGSWALLNGSGEDGPADRAAAPAPATDEDGPDTATAGATGEEAAAPSVGEQLLLGRAGPVELRVPAATAVLVSFHEASLPEALRIDPVGALAVNGNRTRYTDPGDVPGGSTYNVQVSRGRTNAPTSAVDVVLEDDEPVLSPVAGTVVEVREYELYNSYPDVRLELRPDGAPDHAVVLIHVRDVVVEAGQHVEVGTMLARGARAFPFDAVVDRETAPRKLGHVHLEVKLAEPA